MRLKTRRKKRQTNIFKKYRKAILRCSGDMELEESSECKSMVLVIKGRCFYIDKNTKITMICKRKNNLIERKFIFSNAGNITRSPKENIMIKYKKENKEVE